MEVLEGRVAVVTGAASGIGFGLAERFVREGMSVMLADVEEDALQAAAEALRSEGGDVRAFRTDVSDAGSVHRLASHTLEEFGAVHLVCNNAGVESGGNFTDIPLATWEWVLGVNLFGVLHGCREFLPLLRRQGVGHIVNTASLAAVSAGVPTFGPYVTSKFGVLGLSENLQTELRSRGEPIGVSVILPGPVRTKMTESERNRPAGVPSTEDQPERQQLKADLERGVATSGMEPAEVAALVVDAVRANRFYILTHPDRAVDAVAKRLSWMKLGESPGPRTAGT